jgi:excisionase family DNA binding protein
MPPTSDMTAAGAKVTRLLVITNMLAQQSRLCKMDCDGCSWSRQPGAITDMQNTSLRTVAEAAAELTVSPLTVRAWISRGRIGVTRIGRCVRVPAHEIQRLVEGGFTPSSGRGRR